MRVVVIGAGITGLVAARNLRLDGAAVTIIERSAHVGGRMATRRIGAATFDHGAQFFTVRTPAFDQQVRDWVDRGLVRTWNTGFEVDDGYPRYVAARGMNSLAKDLAVGTDIQTSAMAFAVRERVDGRHRWSVTIDDGSTGACDAVVLTLPLPQSFALLADSTADLDEALFRTHYERTISLMAVLDRPISLAASGGLQHPTADIAFVGDNAHKGISSVPALTVHAAAGWSDRHWDDEDDAVVAALKGAVRPWLGGATITQQRLKKWRFATPSSIWPDPCWTTAEGTIAVAGDAFAGPRIEGAHNSGLAAAHALQ